MKGTLLNSHVLVPAFVYSGIFLVLATCLWFVLQTSLTPAPFGALAVYGLLTTLALGVGLISWLLDDTVHQRFVPRLHILTLFLVWGGVQVFAAIISDVSAAYYLTLLEAPLLFLLLVFVAGRIRTTFAPQLSVWWLNGAALVLGMGVVLLAAGNSNYGAVIGAGTVSFVSGVGYTMIIAAGFALVFLSVLLIPLGRRHYPTHPTLSTGPLVFTPAEKAEDLNFIETVDHQVQQLRRRALKRGQWVRYRNHVLHGRGVVSTEPKSCINALATLLEYAMHKNQSRAINVQLLEDSQHDYLHCSIDYVVNTHAKAEFSTFAEHWLELGGHLSVERNARTTTLVVSFPLQW